MASKRNTVSRDGAARSRTSPRKGATAKPLAGVAARSPSTGDGHAAGSPQLLERTFNVLTLFDHDHPEWSTTEISAVSGLPIPTAHRIVLALNRHGFLVRDPATKRFRLGPAAVALGRAALSSQDMPTVAGNLLPALTERTEETSLLTVLSDDRRASVCLLRVESPHPLRLSVQPGRSLPLHAGASQKILFAYLPEAEREAVAGGRLEKFCSLTLDTPEALLEEAERIRKCGWSVSFEETNVGVWGVAVGLLDETGEPVASVGVAGPNVRSNRRTVEASLQATQDIAAEMAVTLGLRSTCEQRATIAPRDLPRALRS